MTINVEEAIKQQMSYSGFEPKFPYTMKGISSDEYYNGNASKIALEYCERNQVLLSNGNSQHTHGDFLTALN